MHLSCFKFLLALLLTITFLGSCKPYKNVSEKEKENELIINSIQKNYEIEKIYKINKRTVLELNLEKGKRYKFQYFSKWHFDMILLTSQLEIIANNKIVYADSSYFTKTIIFECKNTVKYYLKLEDKYFPTSSLLAVASQGLESEGVKKEEYVFIKNYKSPHERNTRLLKNGILRHICVFSKGTTYKFKLEKGVIALKLYNSNNKKHIIEFYPKPKDKEIIFECENTEIYRLEIKNYIENEIAVISLYSSRSDSTKSNTILLYSHYLYDEINEYKKVFAADTTYFFSTKGCGEEIKLEILDKDLDVIETFYFKDGNERFIFNSQKTSIYYIKATKKNLNDNHETTLIIEQ